MKENYKPVERKNIRLKNFDYSTLKPYFITICTFKKQHFFIDELLNQAIIDCLKAEGKQTGSFIYVYCLMSDHLHLLLSPPGTGLTIARLIGGLKSKSTRLAWEHGLRGKLWQTRYFDHILRKSEDMKSVAQYILNNPVRKGLANTWQEYQYCGIIDNWIQR